jgi:cellulose biosynthesis protein BcsQ
MGVVVEALREAKSQLQPGSPGAQAALPAPDAAAAADAGLTVLAIASNKGGVGKTTLATNLALFLRALRRDLPVLVLSLDDQCGVDRMLAPDAEPGGPDVVSALREGSFAAALRPGRFGIHTVASSPCVSDLKREIADVLHLRRALAASGWRGLVIVDTKSDLEILTQNAVAASDLLLAPVRDDPSLREADRLYALLDAWGIPRARACVVLSMIDRRVRYREGACADVLGLLVAEIRGRDYPLLGSFVSHSPKIEALATNPEGRLHPILTHAEGSLVHTQLRVLAEEVLKRLEAAPAWTPPAIFAADDGVPAGVLLGLEGERGADGEAEARRRSREVFEHWSRTTARRGWRARLGLPALARRGG